MSQPTRASNHTDALGTYTTPSNLTYTLLTPSELLTHKDLDHINKLLNEAYQAWGHPLHENDPRATFTGQRVDYRSQLVDEMASGYLVVIHDPSLAATNPPRPEGKFTLAGRYGQVVGIGCVKPFAGRTVAKYNRAKEHAETNGQVLNAEIIGDFLTGGEKAQYASTWNWELAAVAVVDDARYRGRGLASKAVDVLTEELKRQREGKAGGRPLKLWTTAKMGTNNDQYWARRGFVAESLDSAPVGLWSSTVPFEVLTMGKLVR